jgi:hypothetical protein
MTALLAAVMLVAGCQSQLSPAPSSSQSDTATAVASATSGPPAVPTSEELIAAALTSGAITYEQSLLDRSLALFDSPGLPTEFRSPVVDMEAAGALLHEIDAKASTLSADTLKKLAPYRVRPSDPISIFNNPPARTGLTSSVRAAAIILAADTAPVWKSLPAAGGAARVWVKDSPSATADLTTHAEQVSAVWAAYPGIFTYPEADQPNDPSAAINPDGAIDMYFVNAGEIDPRRDVCVTNPSDPKCVLAAGTGGYAPRVAAYHGNKSSGCLVIDANRSSAYITDTIAHELAHTAQFAYDMDESSWLMESTATWVAYKVDKKLGLDPTDQYNWLPQLFYSFDQPLTREANGNAYASWLYFLFASMEKGDGVVTDVWKAAAADGEQGYKAVDQVFPFADHFADFAVRNWNKDPVAPQYKSVDSEFPTARQPNIRNLVKTLAGGKNDSLNVNLPPLASAYFEYDFAASALDVTFDNALDGYADARVWAITKVNGEWKPPEDWTNSPKKKFCRNIPEDNVGTIILVVSNVGISDALSVPEGPKMTAGTTGCSGWRGTMKASESWDVEGGHGTGTSTFTGVWLIDESWNAECDPVSAGACSKLLRPTGTISWTWDSHWVPSDHCDQVTAGTLAAGQEQYPDMPGQALYIRPVGADHLQYWGIGGFGVPGLKCENLITLGAGPPVYFKLESEAHGTQPVGADGGTCNNTIWQIATTGDTMAGSCIGYKYEHASATFEWNLTRVGPAPGS